MTKPKPRPKPVTLRCSVCHHKYCTRYYIVDPVMTYCCARCVEASVPSRNARMYQSLRVGGYVTAVSDLPEPDGMLLHIVTLPCGICAWRVQPTEEWERESVARAYLRLLLGRAQEQMSVARQVE